MNLGSFYKAKIKDILNLMSLSREGLVLILNVGVWNSRQSGVTRLEDSKEEQRLHFEDFELQKYIYKGFDCVLMCLYTIVSGL